MWACTCGGVSIPFTGNRLSGEEAKNERIARRQRVSIALQAFGWLGIAG